MKARSGMERRRAGIGAVRRLLDLDLVRTAVHNTLHAFRLTSYHLPDSKRNCAFQSVSSPKVRYASKGFPCLETKPLSTPVLPFVQSASICFGVRVFFAMV